MTGDGNLRLLAAQEAADVRGTLWIFTEVIEFGLLTQDQALTALNRMRQRGRRLPWKDTEKTIFRAAYNTKQTSTGNSAG